MGSAAKTGSKKKAPAKKKTANKESIKNKLKMVNKLKNEFTDLSVERNRAIYRKVKNEITLKELRSLNKTPADNSITFDIASIEIRKQIMSSIEDKIRMYDEKVITYGDRITTLQVQLKELLSFDDVNLESLFLYKKELVDSSDADLRLVEIESELEEIELNLLKDSKKNNDL